MKAVLVITFCVANLAASALLAGEQKNPKRQAEGKRGQERCNSLVRVGDLMKQAGLAKGWREGTRKEVDPELRKSRAWKQLKPESETWLSIRSSFQGPMSTELISTRILPEPWVKKFEDELESYYLLTESISWFLKGKDGKWMHLANAENTKLVSVRDANGDCEPDLIFCLGKSDNPGDCTDKTGAITVYTSSGNFIKSFPYAPELMTKKVGWISKGGLE